MTDQNIIALISIAVVIIIQSVVGGFIMGKLFGKVDKTTTDIARNKVDIDNLGLKVNSCKNTIDDAFVTNGKCLGLNNQHETRRIAEVEKRKILDNQNIKDHSSLIAVIKELKDEFSRHLRKQMAAIDTMSECLHLMQNDKDC